MDAGKHEGTICRNNALNEKERSIFFLLISDDMYLLSCMFLVILVFLIGSCIKYTYQSIYIENVGS